MKYLKKGNKQAASVTSAKQYATLTTFFLSLPYILLLLSLSSNVTSGYYVL